MSICLGRKKGRNCFILSFFRLKTHIKEKFNNRCQNLKLKTMWKNMVIPPAPLEDKDIMKYVYLLHWKASICDFNMVFLGKLKSRPSVKLNYASSFPKKHNFQLISKEGVHTCVLVSSVNIWLYDPMDSSLSSSVHRILRQRPLEWVYAHSSKGSSRQGSMPESLISYELAGRFFTASTLEIRKNCTFNNIYLSKNIL